MTLFEWLSIMAYYLQLLVIGGGLWMMRETGRQRDRQLDDMSVSLREQNAGLRAVTEGCASKAPGCARLWNSHGRNGPSKASKAPGFVRSWSAVNSPDLPTL